MEVNNDWIGVREGIMRDIVYNKFVQNEAIKRELMETGNASLYEAVTGSTNGAHTLQSTQRRPSRRRRLDLMF